MVEVMKIMETSFKRSHAHSAALHAPNCAAGHCRPTPLPETPGLSQASPDQSLVGSLLLSPGSCYAPGFVCALKESVSPVLCGYCNQIPLQSQVTWGFSVPLPDPQVGESFVGPRTFHFHALEKEMATHFSVLAWRIPGTGEPGGLPSMGSHRVRRD